MGKRFLEAKQHLPTRWGAYTQHTTDPAAKAAANTYPAGTKPPNPVVTARLSQQRPAPALARCLMSETAEAAEADLHIAVNMCVSVCLCILLVTQTTTNSGLTQMTPSTPT